MEGLSYGFLMPAIALFLIVLAILGILMPFFIFKIRNQVVLINVKMDKIIELLKGELVQEISAEITDPGPFTYG